MTQTKSKLDKKIKDENEKLIQEGKTKEEILKNALLQEEEENNETKQSANQSGCWGMVQKLCASSAVNDSDKVKKQENHVLIKQHKRNMKQKRLSETVLQSNKVEDEKNAASIYFPPNPTSDCTESEDVDPRCQYVLLVS
jgi:Fe-S cluster assembly iron-binding protein IscA